MSSQVTQNYPIPAHTPTEWSGSYPAYYPQQNLMPSTQGMQPLPPAPHNLHHPPPSPQPNQNQNAWSSEDDEVLCEYRMRGFGWNQIQEQRFPSKSANACRKRHERLMTKRRSTEWDDSRLDGLALKYKAMRAEIWGGIAAALGEKWEHVEKACMQQGLKSLHNRAANHRRNQSNQSNQSNGSSRRGNISGGEGDTWTFAEEHDSHDDSGISMQLNVVDRPGSGNGVLMNHWHETVLQQKEQNCGPGDMLRHPQVTHERDHILQHPQDTIAPGNSPYPLQDHRHTYQWSPKQ